MNDHRGSPRPPNRADEMTMTSAVDAATSMRCALIGADSLLIECGELLRSRGHEIVAVVSGGPKVSEWGRRIGVAVHDAATTDWVEALRGNPIDHLFAITHLAILPDTALSLPAKGAINFHDGPLPAYAGLNAPAWALMNGESTYGISWHEITSGIDEGDLFKQQLFEVATAETSLSINTRNFEAAIDTFAELVDELSGGTIRRTRQDLSTSRTTYKRNDRPPVLCTLDWQRPALELERLVRALDFGRYANPLGSPTIATATDAFTVKRAELRDEIGEAGEVIDVDGEVLIATTEGSLALLAFETLSGDEVSVDEVISRLGLTRGAHLPLLDADRAVALTQLGVRLARSERFFTGRLSTLEPVELPWATTAAGGHVAQHTELAVSIPAGLADRLAHDLETTVVTAFATVLARLSGKRRFTLALTTAATAAAAATGTPLVSSQVPMSIDLPTDQPAAPAVDAIAAELACIAERGTFLLGLVGRDPELRKHRELAAGTIAPIAVRLGGSDTPVAPGTVVELVVDGQQATVRVDEGLVARADAELFVSCLHAVLESIASQPDTPLSHVDLLGATLRDRVLESWNDTVVAFPAESCIHDLFEQQVDRSPATTALVFEDRSISYRDLDARSNQVAAYLRELGIGPDSLVGVHVERSIELMVAVLGVHKAGGAYVPLDPTYPPDRLEHMIRDSGCGVIITLGRLERSLPLPAGSTADVLRLDTDATVIDRQSTERVPAGAGPSNLAYCIYTSGSTGLPKGVLIEHHNATNFFTGMDAVVAHDLPATWFAVTSLSFDISVLELLYTLTRGFSVVVYLDHDKIGDDHTTDVHDAFVPEHGGAPMDFSLFYFSGDAAEGHGVGKYRLMLEGSKFADTHGFKAVWTPERHFHAFGGLYPHPAVTGAALAAITENVQIRSGSIVLPLHHPIRVAEAWSMVDNLSNGRVGLSIASGWFPRDFVIMPENYADAKRNMFRDIEKVKALWRGEAVTFTGVNGAEEQITTLPRPVQPELPVWVTTAGNPDTFIEAGRIGANVLTHLLGQSVEQLAPKLEAYRQARADAGFDPDTGIVSLMLHTFVGADDDEVRELVRQPMKDYLGTSVQLVKEYAWAFPTFQRPQGYDISNDDDLITSLSPEDTDAVLEFAFLRYYETSGLFGTPESVQPMIDRLKGLGVDEIGCLIDFGVSTDTVLENLPHLERAKDLANAPAPPLSGFGATIADPSAQLDLSPAAQLRRHQVTHLQCTPSMARMFTLEDDTRAALADVAHLYVGGEAFPVQLAKDLVANSLTGNVTNMYGPTETTIWSTTWKLEGSLDTIPIGTPIANTRIYILDANLQLLPPGVPGNLWIGGEGVVRGYHARPELTAERFVADPFVAGARMYTTGDLAKWRTDGSGIIDFLGRIDHQVKIRGYRIELGEIEARLGQHPDVRECVVVVREETPGDQQLVAFVSPKDDANLQPSELKDHLRVNLPDPMIPGHVIVLVDLPHTPNGKIDRNGLPSLASVLGERDAGAVVADAENDLERTVLEVWRETLGMQAIGVDDNFFDIGGHSLLVVRMHRRLKEVLERQIALTELYRFPTIRSFANSLTSDSSSVTMQKSVDRASRRRESLDRRRARIN